MNHTKFKGIATVVRAENVEAINAPMQLPIVDGSSFSAYPMRDLTFEERGGLSQDVSLTERLGSTLIDETSCVLVLHADFGR